MAAHITIDRHIVDALMPDLVGHDRHPSAFLVYLFLWCSGRGQRQRTVSASLHTISVNTGLSKSAVQVALRTLRRRRLLSSRQRTATAAPDHVVHMPWRRDKR